VLAKQVAQAYNHVVMSCAAQQDCVPIEFSLNIRSKARRHRDNPFVRVCLPDVLWHGHASAQIRIDKGEQHQ